MNIFFSGSKRHLVAPIDKGLAVSFEEAGYDLGLSTGRAGHKILVTTDSRKTVDRYIVTGVQVTSRETGRAPIVEIHRMIGRTEPFVGWRQVKFERVSYQQVEQREFKQLGARVGAISACDAVVLIGGGTGTELVGRLALDVRKPVIAIHSFGGAAAGIFNLLEQMYLQMPEVAERVPYLVRGGENWAQAVIEIAEILAGRHTYFLSYSRRNHEEADHIEALLRRRGRIVFRDEEELNLSDRIKKKLENRISEADTFVILWSNDSVASRWCKWELNTAATRSQKTGCPRRIVFLRLDDTPMPRRFSGMLAAVGTDRIARDYSVANLIKREAQARESTFS